MKTRINTSQGNTACHQGFHCFPVDVETLYIEAFIFTVSYVAYAQLTQDCAGLILGISSNELQVCSSTKINVVGVPITLPYMTLWASIYRNCCLHLIDYPSTVNLKQLHDKLVYMGYSFKSNHFSLISHCTKLCV